FLSDDEWFRGMELSAGPDGNVFVLDWSDLGECHEHTGVHRNSGRIYKITARQTDRELQAASQTREKRMSQLASDEPSALIDLVCGNERWFSHHAALRLRELNARGSVSLDAVHILRAKAGLSSGSGSPDASRDDTPDTAPSLRCRLLWTLDNLGGLAGFEQGSPTAEFAAFLSDPSEHVRAAAIRSLTQQWPIDDVYGPHEQCEAAWSRIEQDAKTFVEMFGEMGAEDSALIRLTLASTLQRLPIDQRTAAAIKLLQLSGTQDINDHNIPKMMWYGVMSRAQTHPDEMVAVASASQVPELTMYLSRSIAEQVETSPNAFNGLIETALLKIKQPAPNANWCQAMFVGIEQGIVGIRRADTPPTWGELKHRIAGTDIATPNLINRLDTLFGEGLSPEEMLATLNDKSVDLTTRLNALEGLVASLHESDHAGSLSAHAIIRSARPLVASPHVNLAAAESLATIDDRLVAELLLDNYGRFRAPLRPNVIALLCTRKTFALALVDRLDKGKLPKEALTASDIRVLTSLGDADLSRRVETAWGRVRETSQERTKEIERLTQLLTPERIRGADRSAGRVLFDRACASCHRMFGNGEQVGPDLTGAQRGNLEYLLSNIVDPDAVVGADYRATKVLTNDGRLLVGLITQRTRRTLTIASATRTETLGLDEVEGEFATDHSPMPSGLLQPLDDEAIADLIAYLQSPVQIQPKQ
ncbi:c-type cytochrome, partial [Rhodopirellula sallentina]